MTEEPAPLRRMLGRLVMRRALNVRDQRSFTENLMYLMVYHDLTACRLNIRYKATKAGRFDLIYYFT